MSKETLIKLPIELENIDSSHAPETKASIESINQAFLPLKSQLQELETAKGISSRKIGQAKKAGQPIEPLKEETKKIAVQIKQIKEKVNELRREATLILAAHSAKQADAQPNHFKERQYPNRPDIEEIKVFEATSAQAASWNKYVANNPYSSVYHSYEFRSIVEKSFGHNTYYLCATDKCGEIYGVLPSVQLKSRLFGNYFVSIPFFNYGGAIADDKNIEALLMEKLSALAKHSGATHIEYRDTSPRDGYVKKTDKASLILSLPSKSEELWEAIGTKVRAQIKKADSHNLTFKQGGIELLNDFYSVFAINMRDLGTPVYSIDFFKNILLEEALVSNIAITYHNNKPVSAAFLISYKDTMEIPWASTLRSANQLNANMFLYWNVLSLAIRSGNRFFDFGRSSKDAGTFKFKKQWGAKEQNLYWHYWLDGKDQLPELNPNNPKYKLVIAIWQRLPVWITKAIGPFIVKNLP